MSALGYLLAALGLHAFMPFLGESSNDAWRSFFLYVAVPSLVAIPLIAVLCESPLFVARNQQPQKCAEVMRHIANMNGQQLAIAERGLPLPRPNEDQKAGFLDLGGKVWAVLSLHLVLFIMLALLDSGRGYFVAGSEFVWDDYFSMATMTDVITTSPSLLNVIASISPLVGLLIGERIIN